MWNGLGNVDATPRFVNFDENMAKSAPVINGIDSPTFENSEDNAAQEAPTVCRVESENSDPQNDPMWNDLVQASSTTMASKDVHY